MVGVSDCRSGYSKDTEIFIFDVDSGTLIKSHLLNDIEPLSNPIWTHGESLRFATADATTITIWEVEFDLGAIPTDVETLPAPDRFSDKRPEYPWIHPTPCRLAFVSQDGVIVWDVRDSRYLLECTDTEFFSTMSFSSNGLFFACSTAGSEVYLWKESLTGYILHGILSSRTTHPNPLLSPNGESILVFDPIHNAIQLWPTKNSTTPPSSILTQAPQSTENFILEFSPDGLFAVSAKRESSTVTALSLKSGVPQLTIDASMEVYGLGVIRNAVVVIGGRKVITWDLTAGDWVPGAWMGLEDSSHTIDRKSVV